MRLTCREYKVSRRFLGVMIVPFFLQREKMRSDPKVVRQKIPYSISYSHPRKSFQLRYAFQFIKQAAFNGMLFLCGVGPINCDRSLFKFPYSTKAQT